MKQKRLLFLLALLLTAATGAWATDYTTLAVGDVIKVGDTFTPTADGVFNNNGVYSGDTYTLMRADIDNDYNVTEKTDGAYYVFKFDSEMYPYIHFEKAFAVTAISDGLEVTNIETVKGMPFYTLAVHESGGAAATTYSVKMKEGTVDAKNWSIASGEKSVKGDAADGLTGLSEGQTVTLTYTGRLKVKGVKATSDAAASVPDGALSGVFSVSSTKKVYFSKGNLRYASSKWSFFDNQYDYYESYSADAWDHFGWSTSATDYGKNTSTSGVTYSGDFVDWGATMGAGWFTLTRDEWTYLFTRTVNGGTGNGKSYTRGQSVNGTLGFVIYPDNYTGEVYSGSDWATFESAGCVFLPAAGIRSGSSVYNRGTDGYYWSASPYGTGTAYSVYFTSDGVTPADSYTRGYGASVRLVREVATSDAEEAKPVTLAEATAEDIGKVVCAAGHLHDAKTAVPDGCTAVGILGKVTETGHGLIFALQDANPQKWSTINGWTSETTYASTTLKVLPDGTRSSLTSYTALGETAVSNWAVAQKSDYVAIFTNLGSTTGDSDGHTYDSNVNDYITTGVGGTAMSGNYISATIYSDPFTWQISSEKWGLTDKNLTRNVRPVLGF